MAQSRANITPKVFDAVKILFKGGATLEEVCDYMNISKATANRIKRAENYSEYKTLSSGSAFFANQKNNESKQTPEEKTIVHQVQVQATHYMMEELQKQTKCLDLIGNKITHIYELLEAIKEAWK